MILESLIPDSHYISLIKNYLNEVSKKNKKIKKYLDSEEFDNAHDLIIDIMMLSFDMDQEIHELNRRNMIRRFKEETKE